MVGRESSFSPAAVQRSNIDNEYAPSYFQSSEAEMQQLSLFGPSDSGPEPKPSSDLPVRLQMIVTVKAAPNPSEKYG